MDLTWTWARTWKRRRIRPRRPQKRMRRGVRLRGPVYERVRREQPARLETRSQCDGMRAGTADEEGRRPIYVGACPCPCPFRRARTSMLSKSGLFDFDFDDAWGMNFGSMCR